MREENRVRRRSSKPTETKIDELIREQRTTSLLQIQNTWLAVGITLMVSAAGMVAWWSTDSELLKRSWDVAAIVFATGLMLMLLSPRIASVILRWELNRTQSKPNLSPRRLHMPRIFRALATIAVCILFVFGCLALLGGFVRIIGTSSGLFSTPLSAALMVAYFGLGIASLILSVAAMKLRQMLE